MPQSIILTGLDLVRSKQEADPGSLSDCQNFEISNIRGLTRIQGMRVYSGGVARDIIDPYVLHSYSEYDGYNLDTITGTFTSGATGWIIKWGSGGNFNAKTGELTTVDGYASVCFSRRQSATLILIALYDIVGRMPKAGDVIVSDVYTVTARVYDSPILASEIVEAGLAIFGSSYAATGRVDGVSRLVNDFDSGPPSSTTGAFPLATNPTGSIRGGFYLRDELYVIGDIETWSFTSGSEEPSIGDSVFLYYAGTPFTGSAYAYTVERVVTTSGDWSAGTAAGKIWLVLSVTNSSRSTVKVPTGFGNDTTSNADPLTIGSLVQSTGAAVWKAVGQNLSTGVAASGWTRKDLGYEVRFSAGDNYPTVLNRANRDTALEATVTTTDWLTCGTAAGWTNSSNAQGATNATVATQANDSPVRPGLTATNFGFNVPSTAVILGVRMRFTRRKGAGAGFVTCRDRGIRLVGVPGISQDKKRAGAWPTALTVSSEYGTISDLWGTSLSSSIVNDTGFGVIIEAVAVNGAEATNREIDSVEISITYKDRSSVVYFGDASTTAITSITRSGSTATVTTTAAHGFATGDSVTHAGAGQAEYNITATITVTSLTVYTYTVAGTPATPATGTITAFRDHSTARVIWYHKEKGDWTTNDAQGTMTLYEVSAPSAIRTGQVIRTAAAAAGTTIATAGSGAEKVYAPPSGALDTNASQWVFTDEVNFFGAIGTEQIFGASGADFAISYDGTYWIRIRTGADGNQDKPRHVSKFGDQLVLGFLQGVCIASDLGYPESYAGVVGGTLGGSSPISDDTVTYTFAGGAQEIKLGDSVHGLLNLADQNLAVGCKNSIQMLVGSGGSLVTRRLGGSSGIIEYTLQDIGIPVFMDHRGVGTLSATDAFGDFARGRLSDFVAPWLVPRLQNKGASFISTTGPIKSFVVRGKNQLRTVFRDRYQLTMTMVGNDFSTPQFTIQKLPFVPAMVTVGITSGGKDLLFLAPYGVDGNGAFENDLVQEYDADDNYTPHANLYAPSFVYQGDVGSSWDGKISIDAWIEINGGAAGREWEVKHYDKMVVHGQCYGFANFGARFAVNFGQIGSGTPQNVNGGTTSGIGTEVFESLPFSKVEKVRTTLGSDGYALTIQFVSGSLYGATSTQTAPYKFRPFTIQSIILLSETLKTRPPNAGT